ncbi:hypothetical protein ARTSIC4J27_264 [Pseudarthrobacter siccitolerans]|uniref:Uncharacterized protein n=1 Tax=Pseudarthrobacter siccitolerans TaxID=861266 RepID=A0A024GWM2_9MICC|nr:hypothetical protein [Pseudarthrobacter siccitolerans]CCQ44340.1 hypothetical protein ARTSIC4J27_264 [Pseudarthrobacter siccitolerans]
MTAAVKRLRASLREAIECEATVTLVLDSGRTLTGTAKEHPSLSDGYYLLVPVDSGDRRPHAFHRSELEEVIFE